jgi:thiamine kinase
MRAAAEQALTRIPGWEGASLSELAGGLTNRSWLVEKTGRRAVLKVDAEPRSPPFSERALERRIQTAAAESGIANAVLYADERCYLTEYVEGTVWQRDFLLTDQNLSMLAGCLRTLHSLPLSGRRFDAEEAARNYVKNIDAKQSARAQHCVDVIRKFRTPQKLCCCHNDLVAGNMITVRGLRLLDWEYACDNDPMFDLAIVTAHHELGEDRTRYFLDAYFEGDGERGFEKLTQQAELYNALTWLWYASRPDADAEQLESFAARLEGQDG